MGIDNFENTFFMNGFPQILMRMNKSEVYYVIIINKKCVKILINNLL